MAVDESRPTGQPPAGTPPRSAGGRGGQAGVASPPAVPGDPLLTVVKGNPTPEEFAALVAVISAKLRAAAGDSSARGTPSPSPWAAYWRRARQPLRPGPHAWRASALPR